MNFYNRIDLRIFLGEKQMAPKETEMKIEPIQAVERALQILELLSKHGSLGLNEIHKLMKINKASLLRLYRTGIYLKTGGYRDLFTDFKILRNRSSCSTKSG